MISFTTRPQTEWTAPGTVYTVGSSGSARTVHGANSSSTAIVGNTNSTGTTEGLTSSSTLLTVGFTSFAQTTARTGLSNTQIVTGSYSQSGSTAYDPPTASYTTGTPASTSTSTRNSWSSRGETSNNTTVNHSTLADTSSRTAATTSRQTITATGGNVEGGTVITGTGQTGTISVTAAGHTAAVTRTFSGTSSTFSTQNATLADSTASTTITDHTLGIVTTSTTTRSTTTTTAPGATAGTTRSTWTTAGTTASAPSMTTSTLSGDVTSVVDATTGLTDTSYERTSYLFGTVLRDTVVLLEAGLADTDAGRGPYLWTFAATGMTESTVGRFGELYASTAGPTVTLTDLRQFRSQSVPLTLVSLSQSTYTSSTAATGITSTLTRTLTNGSSTTTTTDYSGTFALGDVSSALSTWTTTTGDPVSTTTLSSAIFTHSVQVTGYEASTWTSTTTTQTWGHPTSSSWSMDNYVSITSTSTRVGTRASTTDRAFFSSYATLGTGDDTTRVLLGQVSTGTTRVFSSSVTMTRPTHGFSSTGSIWVTSGSGPGGSSTQTQTWELAATAWTEQRMAPRVTAWLDDDTLPALNEARHPCYALGIAGFGGSFVRTALVPHVTTTQGIASGSAFSEVTLVPPSEVSAVRGVRMVPVGSGVSFGGTEGAVRTALVSVPDGITSVISVAATWSSTTSTAGTTSLTTRAATHTLGVVSAISGQFWSRAGLTLNSAARTELAVIGPNAGGYACGDNVVGSTFEVVLRSGAASWTAYTAGESTAAATSSGSGTDGSLAFTVGSTQAVVISAEPVLTARWDPVAADSVLLTHSHLSY